MDPNKVEQIQLLLELIVESVNELALTIDVDHLTAIELFELAVQNGIEQYQFVTKKPVKRLQIGKIDTTKLAFTLQDNETTAILQGPANWLDDTEFDTLGGDEPYHDDEEF